MEDEAERLEILHRGLDGQPEPKAFRRPARPERLELLAARPGPDPRPFLTEPGDERGPVQLGDRADPAQPEAGEPGTHVRVRREEAGRMRGEEVGFTTGCDEVGGTGPGEDGGHGRAEASAGDPGPDAAEPPTRPFPECPAKRFGQPLDEHRLRPPQRLEAVDL